MYIVLFFIALAIALACYAFILHNQIMPHKQVADERWLYIEALLKRRIHLTQHLLSVAKGHMQHETEVTTALNKIRSHIRRYGSDPQYRIHVIQAEFELSEALTQLLTAAQKYPDLQANEAFLNGQKMLSSLEEELQKKAEDYNQATRVINKLMKKVHSKYIIHFFEVQKLPPFSK